MVRPATESAPTVYSSRTYATWASAPTYTLHSWVPWMRQWTGSVTPGFSKLTMRQKKHLPPRAHHVYTIRKSGTRFSEYDYYFYGSSLIWSSNAYTSIVPVLSTPGVTHVDQAYTLARARLADKVNKLQTNVAQFFGERHQVVNMMADTVKRVASLALALKRVDPQGIYAALGASARGGGTLTEKQLKRWRNTLPDKRIANHWLELQYGWKPLLQDLHGAAELFAYHANQDRYNCKADASGKAKNLTASSSTYVDWSHLVTTKCKIGMRYGLDSIARQALAQTGIDNPALLAWELMPYSFVVDWFLPVGNYLEALNAFSGFTFIDGWVSYSTKSVYNENRNKQFRNSHGGVYKSNGDGVVLQGLYDRNVLTSFPSIGKLSFKNPVGGAPAERFATAYSLLRVLFQK